MSNFAIDIERQLTRLGKDIQNFVERISPVVNETSDFTPDCDIIEGRDTYRIVLDLPGLSKKQISVSLKENILTVKGDRSTDLNENEQFERRERRYGAFSRSFALPESVETESVDASFKNGVLTIKMARSEKHQQGQSIPVS